MDETHPIGSVKLEEATADDTSSDAAFRGAHIPDDARGRRIPASAGFCGMSMMQHEFDEDDDDKCGDSGVAPEPRPLFMHANGVKVVYADTPQLVGRVGMFDVAKTYVLDHGGEDGSRGMWSTGLEQEQSPSGRVVGLWYHDRLYGLKHCADLARVVDDDANGDGGDGDGGGGSHGRARSRLAIRTWEWAAQYDADGAVQERYDRLYRESVEALEAAAG
ncbi:hypothetical protein HK405_000100, partial [Cladochytrium tenue]